MRIGVPKEIKTLEHRVGLNPDSVLELTRLGHEVVVETNAGVGIDFTDEDYVTAGAKIVPTAADAFGADLVIKVKEPQPQECEMLSEGQTLFTYLHLAADKRQAEGLMKSKAWAIAYETVTAIDGGLPLLKPMSEVAGRISIQAGANALHMASGGRGVLLGGVPGVSPGKVVIIGGGIVGTQAAKMGVGLGADVTILDSNLQRLRELDDLFEGKLKTLYSTPVTIEEELMHCDLVVGAVLIPGKLTPKLITKEIVKKMKHGSVIVDVAIDQGGCAETSRPTTHSDPIFVHDDVVHYCVANMPGACARTATIALTNSVLPYALRIAEMGYKEALLADPLLRSGMNVCLGKVTNEHVAHDLNYDFHDPEEVLKSL